MKGPFSIWSVFGLTLWIDIFSYAYFGRHDKSQRKINPYNPVRGVTVIIPTHKEGRHIEKTIRAVYQESYPVRNVIVVSDSSSNTTRQVVKSMYDEFPNLVYLQSPFISKSQKINYVVRSMSDALGEFVYVRDARVVGNADCIEKMVSYFTDDTVGAVTSYGRLSVPKNFLSRCYYYGKSWVNEVGRFRKNAQVKRTALFVICGASTMYRADVLRWLPIPSGTKTEDTHYTWRLQNQGFKVRVADDAVVSAPEVDGKGWLGIKNQLKQAYRWSSGTIQCFYKEGHNINNNKRLFYSTIIPGFLESVTYAIPLVLLPLLLIFFPVYGLGFLIGDTVFSLLGTLVIIPKKFWKTIIHYPQIFFFKYLNAAVFLYALVKVTADAISGKTKEWYNEWVPQQTDYILAKSLPKIRLSK
jgi:cellulose synthase/poly-beta-1,6-N-acetylglucosamine synthase-like glycosyltransferase